MADSDYTQGYGSFDFLPALPSWARYPGRNNTVHRYFHWTQGLVLHIPSEAGSSWFVAKIDPGASEGYRQETSSDRMLLRDGDKESQQTRTKGSHLTIPAGSQTRSTQNSGKTSLSPLTLLPTELLSAVFQPLVDRMRSRPPGGVLTPAYLPVPDDMGINFVVLFPRRELDLATGIWSDRNIDVVIDPQLREFCRRHQPPFGIDLQPWVPRRHGYRTYQDLQAPIESIPCSCREPADYQALANLSRLGNRRLTAILAEMVWKDACVTFSNPESFLFFAQQRPSAMKHIRGITIAIDEWSLYSHDDEGQDSNVIRESMPLARTLKYIANMNTTVNGGGPLNSCSTTAAPLRFVYIVLTLGTILPTSERSPPLRRVRSPLLGQEIEQAHAERLVRMWAPRFRALPARDFKVYLAVEEYQEWLGEFSAHVQELWMPASVTQASNEGPLMSERRPTWPGA